MRSGFWAVRPTGVRELLPGVSGVDERALTRRVLLTGAGGTALAGCTGPRDDPLPSPSASTAAPPTATAVPDAAHPALARPLAAAVVAFGWLPAADRGGVLRDLATAASAHGVTVGLARSAVGGIGDGSVVPAGLSSMPEFTGDVLRRARTNPDVIVMAEAVSASQARAAIDAVVPTGLDVRWRVDVARAPLPDVGGRAMMRNAFGFAEGQSNPATAEAASIAIVEDGPAWARGGSFLAVRVIQFAMALWDADPVARQEQIMGRRRDGSWLDGSAATATAPYGRGGDAPGSVTPLDSHVRRANPRTAEAPEVRLLRRSWGYSAAPEDGLPDEGLVFMAFTQDLARFETVQRRLAGEALGPYLLTVGGGYFYVPRSDPSWVRQLLP